VTGEKQAAEQVERRIHELLAARPPLTEAQRSRLRQLLAPVHVGAARLTLTLTKCSHLYLVPRPGVAGRWGGPTAPRLPIPIGGPLFACWASVALRSGNPVRTVRKAHPAAYRITAPPTPAVHAVTRAVRHRGRDEYGGPAATGGRVDGAPAPTTSTAKSPLSELSVCGVRPGVIQLTEDW